MNESQSRTVVFYDSPKKNIIITDGFGKVSKEDIIWMIDEVRRGVKQTNGKWAWIVGCDKMDPIIDPECQKIFADLHKNLESEGCAAIAYAVGKTVAMKVQAQRHRLQANDKLVTEYFRTIEEALEWLKDF
ncbi:hypothetical protein [Acetivibrio clariflavus]|uniref:SpoIIAA-like n=1 Tax=Acetivibrio clariflavus (strain DSM 19732 / NBRC 101661 / EBR45) TaxID=720554 RepID=G8LTZ4_ACECE|nr:hypothetical protein [Acetivibrio clariflavus]AEV67340.1 hypothetical protein Clocl_0632 [Acetivibrio clariflavus DSM 19732]